MRAPAFRGFFLDPSELVVDSFAGGGGASTGIEAALGRPVDIAINHDSEAIAMHAANHPETRHFCEDIWQVDPVAACASRPVGLAWFSPDCTHFSRAKGTTPVKKEIRGLAWVAINWAKTVRPRVIVLENVEEFQTWGPLDGDRPDATKAGETFREWLSQLSALGYTIEFRTAVAADYGAPTTRKRFYLVARADGFAPAWPVATHGKGRGTPWRNAAEIIDWSLPCPSIFSRKRPLADATMRRVAEGLRRFALEAPNPYIVRHGHYSTITGAGLREGCGAGTFRGQALKQPLATVCATNDKHLVVPYVTKHYGGVVGHDVHRPLGTVTTIDHHALSAAILAPSGGERREDVRAFLVKYYGARSGQQQSLLDPLHTVTTKARFGLVAVRGEAYEVVDVGMRMLAPHELFAAQGFPRSYRIDPVVGGKPLTKTAQTRCAGNSVCPPVAAAIVAANLAGASQQREEKAA